MITLDSIKKEITSKTGYEYSPERARELFEEGLKPGDKFSVGGGFYCEITASNQARFSSKDNEKAWQMFDIASMTEEQLDSLLKSKVIQGSQVINGKTVA